MRSVTLLLFLYFFWAKALGQPSQIEQVGFAPAAPRYAIKQGNSGHSDLQPSILRFGSADPALTFTLYVPDTAENWQLWNRLHKTIDAAGRLVASHYSSLSNPLDTHLIARYFYDSEGKVLYEGSIKTINGQEKESRTYYSYNPNGYLTNVLVMEPNLANLYDTNYHARFDIGSDPLGRPEVVSTHEIYIQFIRHRNDTLRRRREVRWLDSLYYQSPTSKLYGGRARYRLDSLGSFLVEKFQFTLLDSVRRIQKQFRNWNSDSARWNAWKNDAWVLPNGNVRGTWGSSRVQHFELGFDSRLLPIFPRSASNPFQAVHISPLAEYSDVVYSRSYYPTSRGYSCTVAEDSIHIDNDGRILVRAGFCESRPDTNLRHTTVRLIKYVYSDFQITDIRPSSAPQTLAIAPGPSTGTVLLPALPHGQWQATLVDMQGRRTQLGSPDRTGTLAMPTLPSGVYSLHLKDRTGRHLHGRFAWQR